MFRLRDPVPMRAGNPVQRALRVEIESWSLREPFRITGRTIDAFDVVVVTIEEQDFVGRGEAAGVHYLGEDPASIVARIEAVRGAIEGGIDRTALHSLLACGGARNAVDCALWDLEAKRCRSPVWRIAGLQEPKPLLTTFTCGADDPARMADAARAYAGARSIKLKLTGEAVDAERVCAVREARPDVWLGVDANQGFSRAALERLMMVLERERVALIEQPFRVGEEHLLDGFCSPIPVAADESAQGVADLDGLAGRFQAVNIKLDKCGGLTEALAMARASEQLGLTPMVGNMGGTSLAMAPAFLVGQLCGLVDLDGPVFLRTDRAATVEYRDGFIDCGSMIWG